MKTIIIHESDFDINDQDSIDTFYDKLYEIKEPFEVKFNFLITEIPNSLFQNTKLAKIDIPDSVVEISRWTFWNCDSLTKITLPNSIVQINEGAFHNCALTEITLPSSIKFLGSDIFSCCDSLEKITIQMSKKDFLETVERAKKFYKDYKKLITFDDKSIDVLLSKTNSIEQLITNLEPER